MLHAVIPILSGHVSQNTTVVHTCVRCDRPCCQIRVKSITAGIYTKASKNKTVERMNIWLSVLSIPLDSSSATNDGSTQLPLPKYVCWVCWRGYEERWLTLNHIAMKHRQSKEGSLTPNTLNHMCTIEWQEDGKSTPSNVAGLRSHHTSGDSPCLFRSFSVHLIAYIGI